MDPASRRIVLAIALSESVLVVVAVILILAVSRTAGLVVLGVAIVASSAALRFVIRRAAKARQQAAGSEQSWS
jgi:hypothetical protein